MVDAIREILGLDPLYAKPHRKTKPNEPPGWLQIYKWPGRKSIFDGY
jgi:hypothetical protein